MKKNKTQKFLYFIFTHLLIAIIFILPAIPFIVDGSQHTGTGVKTPSQSVPIKFTNPVPGANNLQEFIELIIKEVILPIGSVVVAIMIIYAGFMFVTARGNEAKLETARRNFLYVAIGTAVLLGAWVIAEAIDTTVKQITTP